MSRTRSEQIDGIEGVRHQAAGVHMTVSLHEFDVEEVTLSWLRLRPMIDNLAPLGQTQGRLKSQQWSEREKPWESKCSAC